LIYASNYFFSFSPLVSAEVALKNKNSAIDKVSVDNAWLFYGKINYGKIKKHSAKQTTMKTGKNFCRIFLPCFLPLLFFSLLILNILPVIPARAWSCYKLTPYQDLVYPHKARVTVSGDCPHGRGPELYHQAAGEYELVGYRNPKPFLLPSEYSRLPGSLPLFQFTRQSDPFSIQFWWWSSSCPSGSTLIVDDYNYHVCEWTGTATYYLDIQISQNENMYDGHLFGYVSGKIGVLTNVDYLSDSALFGRNNPLASGDRDEFSDLGGYGWGIQNQFCAISNCLSGQSISLPRSDPIYVGDICDATIEFYNCEEGDEGRCHGTMPREYITFEQLGGLILPTDSPSPSPAPFQGAVLINNKCYTVTPTDDCIDSEPLDGQVQEAYPISWWGDPYYKWECCRGNEWAKTAINPNDCFRNPGVEECDLCDVNPCPGSCINGRCARCDSACAALGYGRGICGSFLPAVLRSPGGLGFAPSSAFVQAPASLANNVSENTEIRAASDLRSKNENNFLSSLLAYAGIARDANSEELNRGEITNCFDHYKLGSVELSQESVSAKKFSAGSSFNFGIDVSNKNNYPVADGAVFAKIYRRNIKDPNSDFLVDEFIAKKDINLWAGEKKRISFDWAMPENSPEGQYKIVLYFSSSSQFNLSGLSFTPGVYDKAVIFTLKEGGNKSFWFDAENIMINDKKVPLSSWIPTFSPEDEIVISSPIKNELGYGSALINFDLYSFDLLNEEEKLQRYSKQKIVSLNGADVALSFGLPALDSGVYLAKITAKGQGQQSALNVRFAVKGQKGRFIFTGISRFPLERNSQYSIFSCFSNSADYTTSFDGKVNIQLKNEKTGDVIAQTFYEGRITPEVMAIKKDFKAAAVADKLLLVSELYDNQGNLVDRVETEYDAAKFTPLEAPEKKISVRDILALILAVILLAVIVFLIKIYGKRKNEK